MYSSRPTHPYHFQADLIWCDGTFKNSSTGGMWRAIWKIHKSFLLNIIGREDFRNPPRGNLRRFLKFFYASKSCEKILWFYLNILNYLAAMWFSRLY
jgi:hypothetical protein